MVLVEKITTSEALQKAFTIRETVFVQEQGCPSDQEHEHDDIATHFLATIDNTPVGAARWRKTEQGHKLERFAVLKTFRGRGVATTLIRTLVADLPKDATYIYLNAQLDAVPVYEKNGFVKIGVPFEEAGIQHFKMVKMP